MRQYAGQSWAPIHTQRACSPGAYVLEHYASRQRDALGRKDRPSWIARNRWIAGNRSDDSGMAAELVTATMIRSCSELMFLPMQFGESTSSANARPSLTIRIGDRIRRRALRYLSGSTAVLVDPSGAGCIPGGLWPCGLSAGAPPDLVSSGPVQPCGCNRPLSSGAERPVAVFKSFLGSSCAAANPHESATQIAAI